MTRSCRPAWPVVWQQALPDAPLTMFPDTGHLLFHERPETVAAIAEFVDSSRGNEMSLTGGGSSREEPPVRFA